MQKPLTAKDIKKLRKKLLFVAFFAIVAIAIFYIIYSIVLKDFSKDEGVGYIPIIVFGVFGLFFAGIIAYIGWSCVQDIRMGVKNCFEGIVEDKRLDIRKSTSNSRRGSSGSNSSTKRSYYITLEGTEHDIEYAMYYNVNVGDEIYFEIAPKSNALLHYEVLEEAVSEPRNVQKYSRNTYPDSKIKEAPLTRKDTAVLRSFFTQKMRSRLIIIAFLAFPIFGLYFNGLGGLLVFIFPLPIIFLYQLYKLIRFYLKYKKTINKGRKNRITTHVTDKLFTTISHNGAKQQKRTLKTTYGSVKVSEDVYHKVNAGDEIVIHEAMSYIIGADIEETYHPFS